MSSSPPPLLPGLLCTAPPIHIAPFLPHRLLPLLGNVLGSIPMNESYILSEKQSPLFCPALLIQSTSSVSALKTFSLSKTPRNSCENTLLFVCLAFVSKATENETNREVYLPTLGWHKLESESIPQRSTHVSRGSIRGTASQNYYRYNCIASLWSLLMYYVSHSVSTLQKILTNIYQDIGSRIPFPSIIIITRP